MKASFGRALILNNFYGLMLYGAYVLVAILFGGIFFIGCSKTDSNIMFDKKRISDCDAIVRVVVEEEFGGSAYHIVKAKVLRVFMNSTSCAIGEYIGIGYLGEGGGIPNGDPCTVYLNCVIQADECRWKLDESNVDGVLGFSHKTSSQNKR